ncbi:MAG: GLPGLI family protein [Lewinellaceae bacterium]|jgi:GLPGLI family protein|nr:GLPGLI family protein [Lewinellaceae bacterium]
MKVLLSLSFLACLLNPFFAQKVCLNIEYEMQYDLGKMVPNLPVEAKIKFNNIVGVYSYKYSNGYSSFENTGTRKKDPSISGGNLSTDHFVEYKDFNSSLKFRQSKEKPELVSKEVLEFNQDWQIDPQQTDTILGFVCHKATLENGENPIVAWYAPDLPIPDGPLAYHNLPGMILRVDLHIAFIHAVRLDERADGETIKMPEAEKYLSVLEFQRLTRKD